MTSSELIKSKGTFGLELELESRLVYLEIGKLVAVTRVQEVFVPEEALV